MANYEKMYALLFNGVTDALICLDREEPKKAAEILREAQVKAEQIFVGTHEETK